MICENGLTANFRTVRSSLFKTLSEVCQDMTTSRCFSTAFFARGFTIHMRCCCAKDCIHRHHLTHHSEGFLMIRWDCLIFRGTLADKMG